MVITWNTKKVDGGFQFNVVKVGYQVKTEVLKTGVLTSRAKAVTQAKKWTRHFKAQG